MTAVGLPADPVLPGLPEALDAELMRAVFSAELSPAGERVETCEVERVKYRPRRNCSVSYRLRVRRLLDGSEYEQRVSGRLCPRDEALRRLERALQLAPQASVAGPSLRLLPAPDMLTWWWPNDGKLAAPARLSEPGHIDQEVVPRLLQALRRGVDGRDAGAVAQTLEVVQYVPESRLTVRLHLRGRGPSGAPEHHVVYGKASREPSAAVSYDTLCQVHASEACRAGRLTVPRPLWLQEASGLFWQQGLPGVALLDLPHDEAMRMMAPLGTQLAALHSLPLALARGLDVAGHHDRLRDVVDTLGWAFEQLHADTVASARALAAGWARWSGLPVCPLHGDLHPRNVLVDGERLALIDLDGMRMGPAELELGAWVADTIYRAVLDGRDPYADAPAWRAMLQAYAQARGTPLNREAVAWATGWGLLVQRVWRCVVNLKPGRCAIVPQLLAQVAVFSRPGAAELL